MRMCVRARARESACCVLIFVFVPFFFLNETVSARVAFCVYFMRVRVRVLVRVRVRVRVCVCVCVRVFVV